MSLLDKLLKKRGIEHVDELSTEEKQVFDRYTAVLKGENLSVESIRKFCENQIKVIEGIIADGKIRPTDLQLASLHVYLNILKAIEAPEKERESLEKYLNQILND